MTYPFIVNTINDILENYSIEDARFKIFTPLTKQMSLDTRDHLAKLDQS